MEVIIKMNRDEAMEAIEKGTLLALLEDGKMQRCENEVCGCQDALAEVPRDEPKDAAPAPVPQVQTAPDISVQQPVPQTVAPVTQVATTAMTYQLDDLSLAAMGLVRQGMQPQLQKLLKQFGVEALPQLPKEQYGAFATALRGMGAQI